MNILVLSVLCYFHTDDYLFKGRHYNTTYLSFRENIGKIGWYIIRILQKLKVYKALSIFYGYIFSKKVTISKFDYIFINEGWYSESLIEYFLSKTKANIVFQYWNPIDKSGGYYRS